LSPIVCGGSDYRHVAGLGLWIVEVTVYVDNVRHRFGRMIMCHLWADTVDELHAFAANLGLQRSWFQCPPKASWEHYDISLGVKAKAIVLGAVLTDKYGPLEHEARQRGDEQKLALIADLRKRWAA
jgi:hypothetical protein